MNHYGGDVSIIEAKETERELDTYFVKLAQDEFLRNRQSGPGERGCKLLRVVRSLINDYDAMDKLIERQKREINGLRESAQDGAK